MIVALAGLKGGTGKSTLAVNLAAHRASLGKRALLVDSDKQGSAWYWHMVRSVEGVVLTVECAQISSHWRGIDVRCLAPHYDDVIVDTRRNEDPAARSVMLVADRLMTALLHDRKAFRGCGVEGRSVSGLSCEDKRATAELLAVAREAWEAPAEGDSGRH